MAYTVVFSFNVTPLQTETAKASIARPVAVRNNSNKLMKKLYGGEQAESRKKTYTYGKKGIYNRQHDKKHIKRGAGKKRLLCYVKVSYSYTLSITAFASSSPFSAITLLITSVKITRVKIAIKIEAA